MHPQGLLVVLPRLLNSVGGDTESCQPMMNNKPIGIFLVRDDATLIYRSAAQ